MGNLTAKDCKAVTALETKLERVDRMLRGDSFEIHTRAPTPWRGTSSCYFEISKDEAKEALTKIKARLEKERDDILNK